MARSRVNADQPNVIDGVPIGGTTPAAGAFTTLGATGNATLAGTTALTGPLSLGGTPGVAGQIVKSAGAGVPAAWGNGVLERATVQNSTSGTFIDFTGIPSWARRITVMFNGVSTSGTSMPEVRLGTSGGIEATGYSAGAGFGGAVGQFSTSTTGFLLMSSASVTAANLYSGSLTLTNLSGNVWVAQTGGVVTSSAAQVSGGGGKTLAGVLDRIRITMANGTDTFDAGSINIMWE